MRLAICSSKGEGEVAGRLEPLGGTLFETMVDEVGKLRRHEPAGAVQLRRFLLENGHERLDVAVSLECPLAGEHLVQDHAERKDVGPVIDGVPRTCSGDM